jgi:undecaprenyl-phosphate galactose phosphotransferase
LPSSLHTMKPTESIFLSKTKWYCSSPVEKWILFSTDIAAVALALLAATIGIGELYQGLTVSAAFGLMSAARLQVCAALFGVAVIAFWSKGHYVKRKPFANEIKDVLGITLTLALVDAALMFLAKEQFSRAVMLATWTLVPVSVVLGRWALKKALIAAGHRRLWRECHRNRARLQG